MPEKQKHTCSTAALSRASFVWMFHQMLRLCQSLSDNDPMLQQSPREQVGYFPARRPWFVSHLACFVLHCVSFLPLSLGRTTWLGDSFAIETLLVDEKLGVTSQRVDGIDAHMCDTVCVNEAHQQFWQWWWKLAEWAENEYYELRKLDLRYEDNSQDEQQGISMLFKFETHFYKF